jgi:NitT/TauT family transport system permease protein
VPPKQRSAQALASRARLRRNSKTALLPAAVVAALFGVWALAVELLEIPVYILPSPARIVSAIWEIRDTVAMHAGATLFTVLAGFTLSLVVALPLAAFLTLSPMGRAAIYPLLILSQSIPKVALAPILVLLLGTNALPKIVIAFLVAFFPLVISAAAGFAATPKELIELGRSLRANRWRELWRIRLPFAIPFVFSGLKMAMTLAVIGAVVGEFVAADRGLGFLMTSSLAFFNTPVGYGAIMVLSLMAMLLFQLVVLAERVLFPWSVRRQTDVA